MKCPLTSNELATLSEEEFMEVVRQHPMPSDYEYREAFNYCAARLGNMQGLVIKETFNHKNQ